MVILYHGHVACCAHRTELSVSIFQTLHTEHWATQGLCSHQRLKNVSPPGTKPSSLTQHPEGPHNSPLRSHPHLAPLWPGSPLSFAEPASTAPSPPPPAPAAGAPGLPHKGLLGHPLGRNIQSGCPHGWHRSIWGPLSPSWDLQGQALICSPSSWPLRCSPAHTRE